MKRRCSPTRPRGDPVPGPAPTVSVDLARRQIAVEMPHSEWNPGTGHRAAGRGRRPVGRSQRHVPAARRHASATQPGGAGTAANPPAFFDVAFRFNARSRCRAPPGAGTTANPAWWRDSAQAQALAGGDISAFHAEVDFAKLEGEGRRRQAGQPTGVPQSGAIDRILASPFRRWPGRRLRHRRLRHPRPAASASTRAAAAVRDLRPRRSATPAAGWGLTLLLHSLSANYNQFSGSHNQSQFAARGARLDRDHALGARPGRLVLRPRRRRHVRSLGRRRRATTSSTRPSPTSRATRWAATARTSSRASSPTCSPARSRRSARPGWVSGFRPAPEPGANGRTPNGCSPRCGTCRS